MTPFVTVLLTTILLVSARPGSLNDRRARETFAEPFSQPEPCEAQTFENRTGFITTPGFPDWYPNNQNCSYTIDIPDLDSFTVDFYACQFNLEYSWSCWYDYFQIEDGYKFCGNGTKHTVTVRSVNGKVSVVFVSDVIINAQGANIYYSVNNVEEDLSAHCPEFQEGNNPWEWGWPYQPYPWNFTDPATGQ